MKIRHINIIIAMALLLAGWSCTKQDNLEPEGNWELSEPSIISPSGNSAIVLNETTPNETIAFSWNPASSTAGYGVYYSVVIDTLGSDNFDSPILEVNSGNGGKDLSLIITYSELNEALSLAGYPANSEAKVTWAVVATCLSKSSYEAGDLTITRFATEIIPTQLFISGDATENGTDLSQGIPLRRLNDLDGQASNKFELYTSLLANKTYKFYSQQSMPAHQYGGSDGTLVKSGDAITAEEDGQYRISVDLDDNTYSLFKIDKWSVVGSPINGGWGGDEPLEYQGGGVWKASIELIDVGGFVFRANGDWGYLMKRVVGTENTVIMELQATDQGLSYEDIPSDETGTFIFTLDLSAGAYIYTIEREPGAGPIPTPDKLFLLADGTMLHEFTKDADTYSSVIYFALQSGVTYTLNSADDGSGTSYTIDSNIGATDAPGGDKVAGTVKLTEESGTIAVDYDQAYLLSFDFSTAKLTWIYYNLKLFHWSDWDTRDEFVMTYIHPYTFTVTASLTAGYEMKFNSPWDVEFGADDPFAMSGTMTNKGGSNFTNIVSDGTYKATIVVADDYETGNYEFISQ